MLQAVGISKKVDFSEYVVWSVFVSGAIDLAFVALIRLSIPPSTNDLLGALLTWQGFVLYLMLVIGSAIGGAFLLRLDVSKRIQNAVWYRSKSRRIPNLVWDDSLSAHFNQWILVEMSHGETVLGLLLRHSTGDEPRELYLGRPHLVSFAEDGSPSRIEIARAMLVNGANIRSVEFLDLPTDVEVQYLADSRSI